MLNVRYIIENSFKNLIRSKDVFFSLILIFFISILIFSNLFLRELFSKWIRELANDNNIIALTPVYIFYYFTTILAFGLLVFMISYTKNTFRTFILIQKNDIHIMSLLGSTIKSISVEFAIQSSYCLLLLLPTAAFFGKIIISEFLRDFFPTNVLHKKMSDFSYTVNIILPVTLICCIIVFGLNYFFVQRLIKKQMNPPIPIEDER